MLRDFRRPLVETAGNAVPVSILQDSYVRLPGLGLLRVGLRLSASDALFSLEKCTKPNPLRPTHGGASWWKVGADSTKHREIRGSSWNSVGMLVKK